MSMIHGFPPISDSGASILILGSMPSKASLKAGEYYAHPRNAFWRIIQSLYGIDTGLSYDNRCEQLRKRHIAVWDVLKTCTRTSSLDSDIDESSIVANDFEHFFYNHTGIEKIYFNGAMAEKSYMRYVYPGLPDMLTRPGMNRLPSTSPANAAFSFEDKLDKWKIITRETK